MDNDENLLSKINEPPSDDDSSKPDNSLDVTDVFNDGQGSTIVAKGSGSSTQISTRFSLSGIHKELLNYIRGESPEKPLRYLQDDALDFLPYYALLEGQGPLVLKPEKYRIAVLLPVNCSDYLKEYAKSEDSKEKIYSSDQETLRQEIMFCSGLQNLVDMIYGRESKLRDTIDRINKEYETDFYEREKARRAKQIAKCISKKRRAEKYRKKREPDFSTVAKKERAMLNRFFRLRIDLEKFLRKTEDLGLKELPARSYEPVITPTDDGKVEYLDGFKRFRFELPKEEPDFSERI